MARHHLTRRQRDAVRETVIWNLASICTDFEMSLVQREDYKDARRLRREIEDAAALLDNLGWEPHDARESFELSLPRKQLRRIARRLKKSATNDLFAHAVGLLKGLEKTSNTTEPPSSDGYAWRSLGGEVPPEASGRLTHWTGKVVQRADRPSLLPSWLPTRPIRARNSRPPRTRTLVFAGVT
jgi:hypothetical protein